MSETKELKIRFSTVICIILIVLLIAGCGALYYFGFIQKDKQLEKVEAEKAKIEAEKTQIETKNTELEKQTAVIEKEAETKKKNEDVIPASELVAMYCMEEAHLFFCYVENGDLYYYKQDKDVVNGENEKLYFSLYYAKDKMLKYDRVHNIKRIKLSNAGTSVDPLLLLVTENGDVYGIRLSVSMEPIQYEGLKDYKVEKILNHEFSYGDRAYNEFKLLLKDGTTKTVTFET